MGRSVSGPLDETKEQVERAGEDIGLNFVSRHQPAEIPKRTNVVGNVRTEMKSNTRCYLQL